MVEASLPSIGKDPFVSFQDLVELLFVSRFVQRGVRLQVVREAAQAANEMFGEERYAFTLRRFETDGRRIFAKFEAGDDKHMIDLARKQHVFEEVFAPLLHQLDYGDRYATRWWPLGKDGHIVLDPTRAFGRPTVDRFGIATSTLAESAVAWKSVQRVADWYEVPVSTVEAAVAFERHAA